MIPEAATLPRPRFFGPGLLVALPLMVLAALAAAGLRSRWQARMAEAREEAQRTVGRAGREAAAILAEAAAGTRPVRLYPAEPVPSPEPSALWLEAVAAAAEADELRDGAGRAGRKDQTDRADPSDRSNLPGPPAAQNPQPAASSVLSPAPGPTTAEPDAAAIPPAGAIAARFRALRDAPEPAWTDAGLPVAALAAWEVFRRGPTAEDAAALVRAAVVTHPSVVSPVILERAAAFAAERGLVSRDLSGAEAAWRESESLRAVARRHPDKFPAGSSPEGGWITDGGRLWFLRREVGGLAMAAAGSEWDRLISRPDSANPVPRWMALSFWKDGQPLAAAAAFKDTGEAGLARLSLPDSAPPSVSANAGSPVSGFSAASASVSAASAAAAETMILAESRGVVSVRAVLADAGVLHGPLRTEIAWAASLIGAATLAAGGGLWLSRRALLREQRLHLLKSQFVASVSHELRAPIGSVRLMAEALAAGTVRGEAAQSFYRLLAQEGVRLSALIENVLDFARMEAGRRFYQFSETDIAALLRDTAALLEPRAAPRGITLQLELQPLPQVPSIDALAIQQAVMNLLDNALKFSPDHRTVTLLLTPDGSAHWRITIADEGPGIPPAEHRRIFERFHRLGNELRRETQGTGIGLSLVQHIAEGHGGRVLVENRETGGSLFTLRLPFRGVDS